MARLLVENDWFESLAPNAMADTVYEAMLLERARVLFPGYLAASVRYLITNDRGSSTPHLVLVHEHYRAWWLVLLQTGKPPPVNYVVEQAEVLRNHGYDLDFVQLVANRNGTLDVGRLRTLVRDQMPGLYVLLGHPPAPPLTREAIRIGIAEIFRSTADKYILRINGEQLDIPEEVIGTCERESLLERRVLTLTLVPGAALLPAGRCEIDLDGTSSTWTAKPKGGVILLAGRAALPVDVDVFDLLRGVDGRLRLRPHRS